jgi:hypothetical protein
VDLGVDLGEGPVEERRVGGGRDRHAAILLVAD